MENIKILFDNIYSDESKHLRNYLKYLWQEKKLFDVTLRTKDRKSFSVHKIVLISFSSYFRRLSEPTWIDTVELDENVNSHALELILEYIYTGAIDQDKLNLNSIIKLHQTASYLRMKILTNLIEENLINSMNVNNCLILWRSEIGIIFTKPIINEFIKKNTVKFMNQNLLKLNPDEIKFVSTIENLECSQKELLTYFLNWIKDKLTERQIYIENLLDKINYETICADYIQEHIINDDVIYPNSLIKKFILAKVNAFKPNNQTIIALRNLGRNPILLTQSSLNEININQNNILKLLEIEKFKPYYAVSKFNQGHLFFTGAKFCEYFYNNEFHEMPSMLEERYCHSSIYFNKNIYCCGGGDMFSENYYKTVESFDLTHMTWIKDKSMNENRVNFSLVEFDEMIYAIGSYNSSIAEKYDPRANEWIEVPIRFTEQRIKGVKAMTYKNRIYTVALDDKISQFEVRHGGLECTRKYKLPLSGYYSYHPFIYEDELYFFGRDIISLHSSAEHCLYKLNEKTDIISMEKYFPMKSEYFCIPA